MPKKISKKSPRKTHKKKASRLSLIFHFLSQTKTLLIIGIVLILVSVTYHLYEITKYSFTATPPAVDQAQQKRLPKPTHITIAGTAMSYSIIETVIQHGVWQIADNGASHLDISARPGENGTIIIYGHNTLARFGSLPYVSIGQHITITTADNKTHDYVIQRTLVVDPNDTKIMTSQKGEVLLLYTCYGFADLQRFVVLAYPVKS